MPDCDAGPTAQALLGFDYGTRRIGVAVGQRLTGTARALATLAADDWRGIDRLVAEWRPAALVVGLPLALDGSEQRMSAVARHFATRLAERYRLPVHLADERHSSGEAARRFAHRRAAGLARRKHAATLDAEAAGIILEAWLAETA